MSRGPSLPRLLLNNVSCMRNAQQILRHTNISIHDGGALVLTGANGSGKSTFLRMLAGFSKPSAVYGARAIANEKARMLSMGQRKRLQLARVIAMDRPIWLLEPLVALVDEGVKLLEQMIADRRSQGGIVIVATHLPIQIENAMFLRLPPRFPRRITLVDMLPH
ncbi:ABC transporter I family member 1 isoform X1 [Tanacetum coccineum]